MGLTSKTYIVSWDDVRQNVITTCMQLATNGKDHLVFNVGKSLDLANWVDAEKVRYYGHFYNALADFVRSDADIFIFNAGDPVCLDHAEFTSKVERLFEKDPDMWVLAPSFPGGTIYQDWRMHLADSKLHAADGLILASMTDGIWSALRREVATVMYEAFRWMLEKGLMDFTKMISGWGVDYCYCAYAMSQGKKVYRDMNTEMLHEIGKTSHKSDSMAEFINMMDGFYAYLAVCVDRETAKKVRLLFKHINAKVTVGRSFNPPLVEFFGKEIDY